MNAETIITRTDAAIAAYGQSVTLQRTAVDPVTGGITVAEQHDCPAMVKTVGPQSLEAGETREIQVIVSPTGLGGFGLPARDDLVVIDGNPSNIVQIAPLYYGTALCRVNLLCRG